MLTRRSFFGILAGAVGAVVALVFGPRRQQPRTFDCRTWPGRVTYSRGTITFYNEDGSVAKTFLPANPLWKNYTTSYDAKPLTFRGIPVVPDDPEWKNWGADYPRMDEEEWRREMRRLAKATKFVDWKPPA